ncbi:prepilin-type N-terminal cleavage/methylation domain-containing protein [Marinospirillum insulare]|uniref:Prepilin-type N-terminal cleavage/methylation domain-containing protein n=1 Tax=Marinospirillum insulare TaxID=217169 RepID=A0ABQ5ZY54_9GAMM|nr:prepilin-type N-terminal cleavage/methylation domain-containing protein [Marinospirillum insulare]GLR65136.1 hypothetical protein GCM10007878_25750 [Marinospirillum insulare]
MLNNTPSQGFSLLELLISLFLTALMVMGIAQYTLISSSIHLTLQQEALAARALDSLLIQASTYPASKNIIQSSLSSLNQSCNQQALEVDFTNFCLALEQLPQLKVISNQSYTALEWQAPKGKKIIKRPAIK